MIKTKFTDLGRWRGNDPKNKCEAKIDIMGTDGSDFALFCECKWTDENVTLVTFEEIMNTKV